MLFGLTNPNKWNVVITLKTSKFYSHNSVTMQLNITLYLFVLVPGLSVCMVGQEQTFNCPLLPSQLCGATVRSEAFIFLFSTSRKKMQWHTSIFQGMCHFLCLLSCCFFPLQKYTSLALYEQQLPEGTCLVWLGIFRKWKKTGDGSNLRHAVTQKLWKLAWYFWSPLLSFMPWQWAWRIEFFLLPTPLPSPTHTLDYPSYQVRCPWRASNFQWQGTSFHHGLFM